jgi:hypothetical protein
LHGSVPWGHLAGDEGFSGFWDGKIGLLGITGWGSRDMLFARKGLR